MAVDKKYSLKDLLKLDQKIIDAIFIIEKNTGRYLNMNKAASELTGRTLEELKHLTIHDVITEDADKQLESFEGTVTYCRPDNTFRVAQVSMVPLDDKSVIHIARDITHDLNVKKQLRRSQKMEAIGTLAGGIAHDFNNILSGIFGYAQLAKLDLNNPEKIEKNIDQIIKGAQRATDLVQQILMFSRSVEHNKRPVIEKKKGFNNVNKKESDLAEGSEMIMVVDDEEIILNALKIILEKQGYCVKIFKNPLSALKAFTENPDRFDLVITDMTMPGMTGDKFSAKILNIRKEMPIILCTGYSESFTENMARNMGIRKYIQKPITYQSLTCLVRELLDEPQIKLMEKN